MYGSKFLSKEAIQIYDELYIENIFQDSNVHLMWYRGGIDVWFSGTEFILLINNIDIETVIYIPMLCNSSKLPLILN